MGAQLLGIEDSSQDRSHDQSDNTPDILGTHNAVIP